MQLNNDKNYSDLPYFQASTTAGVKSCVSKLSTLVERYAREVLLANTDVFNQLINIRSLNSQRIKLTQIRIDAESAWKNKNYHNVVHLYESIKDSLTKTEQKKLQFAKKHSIV